MVKSIMREETIALCIGIKERFGGNLSLKITAMDLGEGRRL